MRLPRVEVAGFSSLVERIGTDVAAQRMGVAERTVRDWLRRGVPGKRRADAASAVRRSESAARAAVARKTMREMGWRRLRTWKDVDRVIGAEPGHAKERWEDRQEWWEEHRPEEELPERVAFIVDNDGRLLYVNGDQVLWRAYTVDGRLFWTQATYLDGYDSAEEFRDAYESLGGRVIQIHFG